MVEGNLRKLQVTLATPAQYALPLGAEQVPMNALIGQRLHLHYTGEIHCVHCGRKTSKSFNQGYCYPCMQTLAECDSCLIKPEQCHYHQGTCREPAWGEEHCFQDHFVYLANTSGLKVGITRQTNVPTRWLDQGATQALPIYKVRDRLTAGLVEVILKQHVADKTAWQRMLKGIPEDIDLAHERDRLHQECQQEIDDLLANHGDDAVTFLANDQIIPIRYPVTTYPDKVKALNLDKTAEVDGTLLGIKGQYLILDSGVLNIRKFSGYKIRMQIGD
ncbi:MAG: DUF2797 domain-containing protein [Gammaproteobacteria bacterium]|nr:DUF2797 domain-containing protein [Gammaproteobacteria bacterium]